MPPATYLAQVRLDAATDLLRDTALPVTLIAANVGYMSEAAFSRAFKRRYGTPPARWRRDIRARLSCASHAGRGRPVESPRSPARRARRETQPDPRHMCNTWEGQFQPADSANPGVPPRAWVRLDQHDHGCVGAGDTFLDDSPDYAGDRAFPPVVVPPGLHPVPAHRHRAPAPRPVPGGVEEPQHAVRVLAVLYPVRRRFQQLKQALGSQRPAARPARRPAVSEPAPACR